VSLLLVVLATVFLPLLLARSLYGRVGSLATNLLAGGALPLAAVAWLVWTQGSAPGDREAFVYGIGGALVLWLAGTVVAGFAVRMLGRGAGR